MTPEEILAEEVESDNDTLESEAGDADLNEDFPEDGDASELFADSGEEDPDEVDDGRETPASRARKRLLRNLETEKIERARAEGKASALEQTSQKVEQEDEVQKIVAERGRIMGLVKSGELDDSIEVLELLDELGRKQTKLEVRRESQLLNAETRRVQSAASGLEAYRAQIPALSNQASPEYARLARKYNQLVDERGLPSNDATALTAAETVFGDLERLKTRKSAKNFNRDNKSTHQETNGSGGRRPSGGSSWKKGIKAIQFQHWKELGKSEEEMKALAPYVPASMRD